MEPQTARSAARSSDRPRSAGLPREREKELAGRIAQGDLKAEEELVRANLAFVVSIVKRYHNFGVAHEDLVNEGTVGLIEAARRFDPSKETRFVTYAYWWIRKSILRALSENFGQIRVPEGRIRDSRRERAERAATRGSGTEASDMSVAAPRLPTTISLDHPPSGDRGLALHERLADRRPGVDDALLDREARTRLGAALDLLTKQERLVIKRRYGFDTQSRLTLRQLGRRLGISGERVRQIEAVAKRKLRRHLDRQG